VVLNVGLQSGKFIIGHPRNILSVLDPPQSN
jgi:hypothetical protein